MSHSYQDLYIDFFISQIDKLQQDTHKLNEKDKGNIAKGLSTV